MTLSFRLRSGTYKPMAVESTPPRPAKIIKCTVRLLDDNQQLIELEKSSLGQALLDRLFDCLDLAERDYFGLQLLDPLQEFPGVIRWIEPDKKIRKQFKAEGIYQFLFRVRFYTPDPCRLHEEYTRYHFFMQLKLDIAERRVWCTDEAAVLLASYAVQSELGDYNLTEHRDGYLAEFRYFASGIDPPPAMFEQRVIELHKQHRGQSPADAEFNFLYHARNLETYGVVVFEVASFPPSSQEERASAPYNPDEPVHVGVSAAGVSVFRGYRRVLTHPWCNICKVSFKRRQFLLTVVHETTVASGSGSSSNDNGLLNGNGHGKSRGNELYDKFTGGRGHNFDALNGASATTREYMHHVAFILNNPKLARSVWQTAVEYHTFFRLKTPPSMTKSAAILAPFNKSFRYSGRTEFQGIEDLKRKMRTIERPFSRASFNRYARRTVSTLPVQSTSAMMAQHHAPQINGNGNSNHSSQLAVSTLGRPSFPVVATANNKREAASPSATVNGSNGSTNNNNNNTNGSWLSRSSFGFGIVNMTPPKTANGSNGHAVTSSSTSAIISHSRTASTPAAVSAANTYQAVINGSTNATISSPTTMRNGGNRPFSNGSALPSVSAQHPHSLIGTAIPERIEDLPFYEEPQNLNGTSNSYLHPQSSGQTHQQQARLVNGAKSPQTTSSSAATTAASSNGLPHRTINGSVTLSSTASSTASPNFSVPLVTIRLRPDADGRFGFNVKGGVDQQMPVVVSRVAANTPADRAIPRLREGDLLLSINGRDPNTMLHEEVVNVIRSSRDEASGDLVLLVRPQVQVPTLDLQALSPPMNNRSNGFLSSGGSASARTAPTATSHTTATTNDSGVVASGTPPTYRPTSMPATNGNGSVVNGGLSSASQQQQQQQQQQQSTSLVDPLYRSIQDLRDALSPAAGSGSIVPRFEKLERRNASMIVSVATYSENLAKNRYRDITPYDETRVKIKNRPNGDYINASHVNMEIPGAGVVNRYICCQGPLPNTCADFWQMAWEQQSTLVVMLTAQMEQGMVKCHQYWPNVNETCKYDNLQVTCLRETMLPGGNGGGGSTAERQLSLINLQTNEERHVTQLQYMAWPDHGVPDEPRSFIEFVQRVRSLRAGTVEPTIVHCSAGIGRTGVILLVESAMSLVEARQPVDPIEIVRRLRSQRAMLVQNASQFVFACQAILKVFDDKVVVPGIENGATATTNDGRR